jgi:DNA-binding transcriptional regulator YiaG
MVPSPQNPQVLQQQYHQLMEIVRNHTFASQYQETLRHTLEHHTALFETLIHQLRETLLVHSSLQIQVDSPDGIIRALLNKVFEYNQLWDKISQEVWVNLLTWMMQDLELSIASSVIATISQEPYQEEVWQLLNSLNPSAESFLSQLEISICKDLNAQIFQNTPALEYLVMGLSLGENITDIPVFPLTIHSYSALEEPSQICDYLIQSEATSAQTKLSSSSVIVLEHYLTRPSELYRLPWELMAQVKQQCGLPLVQLLCLLMGHAMRQPHPTLSSFNLTYHEIQEQLDWSEDEQAAPPPPPNLTTLLEQLSGLTIATIWMTEPSITQVEAYHTSGHPWEILSETQGNFDWMPGRITQPTQQSITLRPGLWLHHLLQQGGASATTAWEAFGRIALKLLERDHCRNSFFLSLLISLSLDAPEFRPNVKPSFYTVQNLLDIALPLPAVQALQLHPDIAPTLFKVWNQALEALINLGWSGGGPTGEPANPTHFYLGPYPDWLKMNSHTRKPSDWVGQWLNQSLQIVAPADLMGCMPSLANTHKHQSSASLGRSPRRLRFDRLSGAQIRSARKAKQLTQSQLADVLHVHQSLIAKIEVGQRTITEELERSLRQVLEL